MKGLKFLTRTSLFTLRFYVEKSETVKDLEICRQSNGRDGVT